MKNLERRAGVAALSTCLLLATTGCSAVRERAEADRDCVAEGLSQAQVHDVLGAPDDVLRAPNGGEVWRYRYPRKRPLSTLEVVAAILLVAVAVVLVVGVAMAAARGGHIGAIPVGGLSADDAPHEFNVVFGPDGRVCGLGEVAMSPRPR